jgi:hypothetical protein
MTDVLLLYRMILDQKKKRIDEDCRGLSERSRVTSRTGTRYRNASETAFERDC